MSYLSLYEDKAIVPYSQLSFTPVESPSLKMLSNKKEEIAFGIDGRPCIPDAGPIGLIESGRRCRRRGMPDYIYSYYMLLTIFMQLVGSSEKLSVQDQNP